MGTESNTYTGKFDGNGYTIKGLYVNTDDNTKQTGLFGCLDRNASVKNINIENSVISGGVVGCCLTANNVSDLSSSSKVIGNFDGGIFGTAAGNTVTYENSAVISKYTCNTGYGTDHAYPAGNKSVRSSRFNRRQCSYFLFGYTSDICRNIGNHIH